MSVLSIYKHGNNDSLFLGTRDYRRNNFNGIIITNHRSQFKYFRNLRVTLVKEKLSFQYSTKEFDIKNKIVSSIPEMSLLFFYSPSMNEGNVVQINTESGNIKMIPFNVFETFRDSFKMVDNVRLTLDKKMSKKHRR